MRILRSARRSRWLFVLLLLTLFTPAVAQAHVKWFSNFSFSDPPRDLGVVLTPTFLALTALTFVALALAVFIESRLDHTGWYQRIIQWFVDRQSYATLVLRIGMGVTLLLSWQADTLLVPQLYLTESWVGWMQFAVAALLLFPRTTPLAGGGVLVLYLIGVAQFGPLYMLDYFLFVGVAAYLMLADVRHERVRALRIPALYFAVGFSLCWVALEKVIYPDWGLYVLQQNPELSLGFDIRFFLLGAAFVEFALGYLLIIGLLERPMALVITLVFFMTTLVFGKLEVIGHTIIHASLIVFLLEGPGNVYPRPVDLHRRLPLRMAFASVNFIFLLIVLIVPYHLLAEAKYEDAAQSEQAQTGYFMLYTSGADHVFTLPEG